MSTCPWGCVSLIKVAWYELRRKYMYSESPQGSMRRGIAELRTLNCEVRQNRAMYIEKKSSILSTT